MSVIRLSDVRNGKMKCDATVRRISNKLKTVLLQILQVYRITRDYFDRMIQMAKVALERTTMAFILNVLMIISPHSSIPNNSDTVDIIKASRLFSPSRYSDTHTEPPSLGRRR